MISISIRKALHTAEGDLILNADLELERGTINMLYGASGAGKTSTLRMLAGLMRPDGGTIDVNGKSWFDAEKKINLKPQQRKVGFMFQDYALFPNMTVRKNLEFAMENGQKQSIIDHLIELIELGDLQHRKTETLSGGQKQRVAFARALVNKPEIVLLDEPLAALDINMRTKLQDYILQTHREYGYTILIISHDIGEILKLSKHLYVIEKGKILPPQDPASYFTSGALSGKFQLEAQVIDIKKEGLLYILTLLAGNRLLKIVAQPNDAENLQPGDRLMVAAKGFNPLLYKL